MTTNHPIIPPPELVTQWRRDWEQLNPVKPTNFPKYIATQAARWGADQELEAVCEWLRDPQLGLRHGYEELIHSLRKARRPKPLSLKQQALAVLDDGAGLYSVDLSSDDIRTIRRALEALDDSL